MSRPLIECCVDSFESAKTAFENGADRLELCANLVIGGTTPSINLAKQIKKYSDIKINALIRPRFGDFLYTENEIEIMCNDIKMFKDLGINGIVIGVLNPDGTINEKDMKKLISYAGDMEITLHRAFDMTKNPYETLETAINLGIKSILTSGQERDAFTGKDTLKKLHKASKGRIVIMAGSGVKIDNIKYLYEYTGISTFHTSGRKNSIDSKMIYRKERISMGLPSMSEYEIWQTDPVEFGKCANIVHSLQKNILNANSKE